MRKVDVFIVLPPSNEIHSDEFEGGGLMIVDAMEDGSLRIINHLKNDKLCTTIYPKGGWTRVSFES